MSPPERPEETHKLDQDTTKDPDTIASSAQQKQKDAWDKFSLISQFVSGVVIALVGGIFTYSYQKQQVLREQQAAELQRVQTIGAFMPFLTSKDASTKYSPGGAGFRENKNTPGGAVTKVIVCEMLSPGLKTQTS